MLHEVIPGVWGDDGMDRYKNLRPVPYPIPPVFDTDANIRRRHREVEDMIGRGEIPEWMEVVQTQYGPRLQMDTSFCKHMQMYNECLVTGQRMLAITHRRK